MAHPVTEAVRGPDLAAAAVSAARTTDLHDENVIVVRWRAVT